MQKPVKQTLEQNENPEWTRVEIANARPALEVLAEAFGQDVVSDIKRLRGRPKKASKKVSQTLRLDPDVLTAYRESGRGWQSKINKILRENMSQLKQP